MGSENLFKKRRAERKQRRFEYKKPRANSCLIVTEGEKTEPLYDPEPTVYQLVEELKVFIDE